MEKKAVRLADAARIAKRLGYLQEGDWRWAVDQSRKGLGPVELGAAPQHVIDAFRWHRRQIPGVRTASGQYAPFESGGFYNINPGGKGGIVVGGGKSDVTDWPALREVLGKSRTYRYSTDFEKALWKGTPRGIEDALMGVRSNWEGRFPAGLRSIHNHPISSIPSSETDKIRAVADKLGVSLDNPGYLLDAVTKYRNREIPSLPGPRGNYTINDAVWALEGMEAGKLPSKIPGIRTLDPSGMRMSTQTRMPVLGDVGDMDFTLGMPTPMNILDLTNKRQNTVLPIMNPTKDGPQARLLYTTFR